MTRKENLRFLLSKMCDVPSGNSWILWFELGVLNLKVFKEGLVTERKETAFTKLIYLRSVEVVVAVRSVVHVVPWNG